MAKDQSPKTGIDLNQATKGQRGEAMPAAKRSFNQAPIELSDEDWKKAHADWRAHMKTQGVTGLNDYTNSEDLGLWKSSQTGQFHAKRVIDKGLAKPIRLVSEKDPDAYKDDTTEATFNSANLKSSPVDEFASRGGGTHHTELEHHAGAMMDHFGEPGEGIDKATGYKVSDSHGRALFHIGESIKAQSTNPKAAVRHFTEAVGHVRNMARVMQQNGNTAGEQHKNAAMDLLKSYTELHQGK